MVKPLGDETNNIGIVCARQAAVTADRHYEHMLNLRSACQKWMQDCPPRLAGYVRQHLPGFGRVGTRRLNCRHRLANLAGTDSLQGTCHLRYISDAADPHPHFTG
jgi:hypothetical protein